MFVASEIVIAKNRGFWLAMKFAMTKGAMDNLASIGGFQGYHNGKHHS